jgi:hypothetical protein
MEDSAHPFHQLRERMPESVEFFVVGKGHRSGKGKGFGPSTEEPLIDLISRPYWLASRCYHG